MPDDRTRDALRRALADVATFSRLLPGYALRSYQVEPARAIADRVLARRGDILAMVFARQAGKDETLAQLLAYLLLRHARTGGSIVVAAPTRQPQANIARDRLIARLRAHPMTSHLLRVREGYEVHVGAAKASFVSAAKGAGARGQTASLLLVANEAQDIAPDTWDSVFDPMAASTNAPTLFLGTVWTADTLLARQMTYAAELEQRDGVQRLWRVTWQRVAEDVPAYGERVRARIAQLGATHPFIRTEYELIPLDGDGGMFGAIRQQLITGTHPRRHAPFPGETIALLIDIAGADEDATVTPGASFDPDSRRDSTALTVVSVVTDDELPHYQVLDRVAWTNVPWPTIEGALRSLIRHWNPAVVLIDATGIGFGMYSRLAATERRRRIEPFTFTAKSKSDLGWATLGLVDSGRLAEYADDGAPDTAEFWWQLRHTLLATRSSASKLISYGVPAGTGHDDLVMSWMLAGALDELDLRRRTARGT